MCIVLYKYTAMDFNAGNKLSCIESEFIRMYIDIIDILLEDQCISSSLTLFLLDDRVLLFV